ncbi:MAG: DUF4349 domain-containing protein [Anaerolineae bacterium]|jgi:hypothetical protein|nr:DUF4349 domain-containing protein [Anaerolineae bacterium]
MKQVVVVVLIIGMLFSFVGCAAPARQAERAAVSDAARAAGAPAPSGGVPATESNAFFGDAERMIARTADVSMIVADTEPAMQSITALVAASGGYIADSKAWREQDQVRGRISARVPAEKLDGTLGAIKKLATRVERENIGGKDVTEEYSDLNAQLVNLEATEIELRELLTEVRQKTQKAEDVLKVYQELTKVRGEIERVKGRMQYLGNLAALATVTIELIPDILAKPVVESGWRPLETLKNAGRSLVNALKGLADIAIWLIVYLLPLLLVIAIPIVLLILLVRWLTRRRRRARQPQAQ